MDREPFPAGWRGVVPRCHFVSVVRGWAQAVLMLGQAVCLTGAPAERADAAAARPELRLDGTWDFATDPDRVGEQEQWFLPEASWPAMPRPGYAPVANGQIRVPGVWDNQGYGTETDKVRHNFVGLGWYRKRFTVPVDWAGRRVFLCVGGVHRYAKLWMDGAYLGEQIGYLSEFEFDVTGQAPPGRPAMLTIQVDSQQRQSVDTMFGASDLADYMDVVWGGIWGHVRLEARSAVWLSELFVQPSVSASQCSVSARLNGDAARADWVRLEVFDREGERVARVERPGSAGAVAGQTAQIVAPMAGAELWSPDTPVLYRARLSLGRGPEVLDAAESRFGMREIRLDGPFILLNGRRLFLRGYGDDHIYPDQMAMPADKELHLQRLRRIKDYGFNHVRHHSTIMPPEYYDACDEVGIMPTAEFAIAYDSFLPGADNWKRHVPAGTDTAPAFETYRREWAAAIKRHRNHPSLFAWVMGNELWNGIPLRHEFQRIARELDPTRPFADTDGITEMWQHILDPKNDRETLDLYFLMFDVSRNPLDLPDKFKTPRPLKPIISHESGNYVTFSRPDLVDEFRHNIKPFWMIDGRAKLEKLGLLPEAERWAEKSERLYLLLHKTNLEALRHNPFISGYHWWLFQDYWTTANGLVDHYFRPKAITPEEVRRFNNEVVLLQEGLEVSCRGQELLQVKLRISNFSPAPLVGAELRCHLWSGPRAVFHESRPVSRVGQGEVLTVAELSTTLPPVPEPTGLRLEAELVAGSKQWSNQWVARLYPAAIETPALPVPVFATHGQRQRWEKFPLRPLPPNGPLPEHAVYLAGSLTPRVLAAVERGACLVLLDGGRTLSSRPLTYRSSWWKAGDDLNANLCGTIVYDHPVTRQMAPDGWCDAGWLHLLEGGRKIILESFPTRPHVIVRGLPSLRAVEDCAMLFEVGVGQGALIVSSLNHHKARGRPENEWLVSRLLHYAASLPQPVVKWPVSALPSPVPPPAEHCLAGFQRLIRNEGETTVWHSYREDQVQMPVCRQTQPGQLVEWETAPVPAEWTQDQVTFVFAGGLGWRSQPKTEGFTFVLNGADTLGFDLGGRTWSSAEQGVELQFVPRRELPEDQLGLFYVTLARGRFQPGSPCRLGVRSLGRDSRRWFGLNLYSDLSGED